MKHIKKFNENLENTLSFEGAKKWIKDNYSEERVAEIFDEEINSGNWIDRDQMEDEGYESEYDYYIDYGHGEAESAVMDEIISDLKKEYQLNFDELSDETNIYDFLKNEFENLNHI